MTRYPESNLGAYPPVDEEAIPDFIQQRGLRVPLPDFKLLAAAGECGLLQMGATFGRRSEACLLPGDCPERRRAMPGRLVPKG